MNKIREQEDGTLSRNNIKWWTNLISEYNQVKAKKHPRFKFVTEFYNVYKLKRQNFIKYYNRYQLHQHPSALLPQKRGPRYKTRRTPEVIENKVIDLRKNGLSRYEIYAILKDELTCHIPSPSTIYNIARRYNYHRLKPTEKQIRRRIIKEKAGELGHIDCHYLPRGLIEGNDTRYYLLGLIDDATRITWVEVIPEVTSLTVMFNTLKMINLMNHRYQIKFNEILSDNGGEFGGGPFTKNKVANPFERLLMELNIKHRYTRPYRPQTNGKIERFWKTLNDDLIEDTLFDSLDHFKDELQQYLLYYNELRPHQSLNGKTPLQFNESCHRIT